MGSFRVALLTRGHPHAFRILESVAARGGRIDCVVFERHTPDTRRGAFVLALKRIKHSFQSFRIRSNIKARFPGTVGRVVTTGPLNSASMVADLEALNVDYLLLGGVGIISEAIIDAAKKGVINSHPGLLPWMRNLGVVGRSLMGNVPLGGTVHFVNKGIDTGAIIERRLLKPCPKMNNLADCEDAAYGVIAEMMAGVVVDQLAKGRAPVSIEQSERFPPSTWLSESERKQVDVALSSGLAETLFEASRNLVEDVEKLRLPANYSLPEN